MKLPAKFAAMILTEFRVQDLIRDQDDSKRAHAAFEGTAAMLDDLGLIIVQQDLIVARHTLHQR